MWFVENIGSIIISLAIIAIVTLIVVSNLKSKKKGKSSCGCGCSNCSMNGICHSEKEDKK